MFELFEKYFGIFEILVRIFGGYYFSRSTVVLEQAPTMLFVQTPRPGTLDSKPEVWVGKYHEFYLYLKEN